MMMKVNSLIKQNICITITKVGNNHTGDIMKAVPGKEIDNVPDEKRTVRNINDIMFAESLKQLSDVVVKKGNTIYTDEASKFGTKISGYHACDKERNFGDFGFRELSFKLS